MKAGLAAAAATALAAPALAVLAVLGAAGTALTCLTAPGPALADTAPVPAPARAWIAAVQNACPWSLKSTPHGLLVPCAKTSNSCRVGW